MIKKILVVGGAVVAVVVLGFLAVVAAQPNEYAISRSAKMAAAPEVVFEQVNDFHKFRAWNPWVKLDPNAKYTFEGPDAGKDSKLSWAGNDQVGEGSMLITESEPSERVKMKLVFVKPMQDSSDTQFTFEPAGTQTNVTWTMSGKYPSFFQKAICKCMNMDKMVGAQFEKGLTSLKAIAEKSPAPPAEDPAPEKPAPDEPAAPAALPANES